MQVATSLQGQVIPYLAGRQRVPINLGWYGDFTSKGNSSGKGGGAPSSYNYSSAWIGLLTIGQIQGITQVWHDQSQVTLEYENLAYAVGGSGQPTWTGYPAGTPTEQQIPYDHISYVATSAYNLGNSPALPNLTFEVEGVVPGYSNAHGVYDADPSAVVLDYMTNAVHGAGFSGTIQTLTGSTNTYQAYCLALGLVTSPYENNQRAATDFMKELMQITNSDLVLSCGTLKVIPYADTAVSGTTPDGASWSYTPNLTPVFSFTDDDFFPDKGEDPVVLKRKALTDTYNIVNVEYNDRANYYNTSPASASDNLDISIRGPRPMSTLTFQQITTPTVAKTVAQLILQFQLYERNTYEFKVRADYSLLEPMDYVAITDSGLGLTNQVVRIIQVQDDSDNRFMITAMEVPGTVRNTPQYNWASAQGYAANFDASPGSVCAPEIFQMPPVPASISNGITIGIAVCGQSDQAFWGGCQAWCSTDGGDTYEWVGTIGGNGPARYGVLTAGLPEAADPDTSSTLSLVLANTTEQLSTTVTDAQADAAQTLLLVGNGSVSIIPTAPVLATPTDGLGTVTLGWSASTVTWSSIASYEVYRSVNGGSFSALASVAGGTTSYVDTAVSAANTYSYYITATSAAGNTSANSNTESGTPTAQPTTPVLSPLTAGSGSLELSWSTSTVAGSTIASYEVEMSTDGVTFSPLATVTAPTTTYNATGLSPSETYYFYVYATSAASVNSANSNTESGTPHAAGTSITITPATNIFYEGSFETNGTGFSESMSVGSASSRVIGSKYLGSIGYVGAWVNGIVLTIWDSLSGTNPDTANVTSVTIDGTTYNISDASIEDYDTTDTTTLYLWSGVSNPFSNGVPITVTFNGVT